MRFRLTSSLLIGTALLTPSTVLAQTMEERLSAMENKVQYMENRVEFLEAELAKERAKNRNDVIRLEKKVDSAPSTTTAPKADSGFMLGDTTIKVGGFVDADLHFTSLSDAGSGGISSNSIARDFYIPGATPVSGDSVQFTDFTAQASRITLSGERGSGDDKAMAYIEMDFLGSAQGNELVSNSYSPRLRRAFVDYKGWRIGQEWTTFQNLSAIPESASFLGLSDGMVFGRQAMVRYTSGNWQFALENPNTTSLNFGSRDENVIPDVIARYNMKGDYGNISFAAMARQLRADFGPTQEDVFGYGFSVSGRVKVGEKDDIRFGLTGGEGLGRYIGLAASRATALNTSGDLEAISSFGGHVAYRHPFGETARFNIGYSALFVDNPSYLGGGVTKDVQSAYGAVLWDIAPKVTVGTELLYGMRELENGSDGSITRFTFSTKYGF